MVRICDPALPAISVPSWKSNTLLARDMILRNACTICDLGDRFLNAYLDDFADDKGSFSVVSLRRRPFAILECKRVGVEEGMKKGPQTIEKAKQGAYVAKTVSSLQKVRFADGKIGGLIQLKNSSFRCEEYYSLLAEVIASDNPELLSHFVLTIGVVSNHGNWFTSENHNKELKVLAQSFDWLLFLTDAGIAQFIDEVLLHPKGELAAAREAFLASYTRQERCQSIHEGQNGLGRRRRAPVVLFNEKEGNRGLVQHHRSRRKTARRSARGTRYVETQEVGGDTLVTAGRKINTVSQEWGTPPKYVDAVRKCFGGRIDLDPCSNEYSVVHAETEYRLPEHDGLSESWNYPTIYVNPPYGIDKERGTAIKTWMAQPRHCAQGIQLRSSRPRSRCDEYRALEELRFRSGHVSLLPLRYAAEVSRQRRERRKGGADVMRDGLLGKRLRRIFVRVFEIRRGRRSSPSPQ